MQEGTHVKFVPKGRAAERQAEEKRAAKAAAEKAAKKAAKKAARAEWEERRRAARFDVLKAFHEHDLYRLWLAEDDRLRGQEWATFVRKSGFEGGSGSDAQGFKLQLNTSLTTHFLKLHL
ncbi:MAG: hypothetical protein ACKO96_36975 [Flammeovirgaceae bacterium]